jgi:hypothetical protein
VDRRRESFREAASSPAGERPRERVFGKIGISRHIDHHTRHPTFFNLSKILSDNGFVVEDVFWQPY